MSASFIFAYVHSVTQRYRQRRAWKVLLHATMEIWKIYLWQYVPQWSMSCVKRRMDHYILFSVVSNTLQNLSSKDNMSNTSAITAVIKYSMKPWHGATTNCHLCGYGEWKEGIKKIKVALWYIHCTCFGWWKGLSRDKAMRISKKKRLVSLSSFWVALVWRHQIFS